MCPSYSTFWQVNFLLLLWNPDKTNFLTNALNKVLKFLGLVDNRLVGFPDLWFHPCICQTWQLKQQVENQFDLSPHEGSIKLWDMSGKLDCQTGSLSSPLGSIILYKMIICLPSNWFEETIWIRLLLQHTRIVRIVK